MSRKRGDPDEYDDDDEDDAIHPNQSFDDDDDEDERRPAGGKKKKRKKGNALLDLEAEEDDAEDEDEDEDLGVRGLIADDDDDGEVDRDKEQIRAQRFERERAMRNEDPGEMERYFRERFGDDTYAEEEETGAPDTAGIDQQSLLPNIRDPRLYIVRCKKPGHERRAILSLLQKSFNLKRKGIDIGIFSAVAPDHLRGRIYIESFSSAQVEFAINGLDLFSTYEGIKALRLEEMPDVLKVGKRIDKQVEGNWVRMSRGLYKGDLAQVCAIREGASEGQLMIRLIPRLDLKGEKDYMEDLDHDEFDDDKDKNGPRRKGRPPQKLFDKKELFRLTGSADVYAQRDRQTGEIFEVWNDELYRYGLLYKRVSVKTLVVGEAVQPQVDELEKWLAAESRMRIAFEDDPTSMSAEDARRGLGLDINSIAGKRNTRLFKGDSVRVTTGEQKGLTGTIASLSGDVVLLQTSEFPEPLRVARADVTKTFRVGDHIKVSSGKKTGYAGAIVAVDGDFLTVFTDSTREEIRVLSSQVADSADLNSDLSVKRSTAAHNQVQYELFDLVQMLTDSNEKGVVIQVRNEGVSILTAQNTVRIVPANSIKTKLRDDSVRAIDARGNPIAPNDTIHVVSGMLKDRQGIVKHVAGSTVFFKARDEMNNCGMLAVAASECTASTAAARRLTSTMQRASANTFKMPAPIPRGSIASVGRGGSGATRGGSRTGGSDVFMRKEVKVTRGPYKGYKGRVIDVTEKTARVELISKMKTITIGKDKLKLEGGDDSNQPSFSSLSSGLRGRSRGPEINGMQIRDRDRLDRRYAQTPRAETYSQTPRAGYTPRGGATPSRGSHMNTPAQNGFGSFTPARNPFTGSSSLGRTSDFSYRGGSSYNTPMPSTPGGEGANPYANNSFQPQVPRTPATPAGLGVPSTPANQFNIVEPRTPANIVEPNTPAYAGIEPRTPAPGLEPRTPAPGLEPRTPAPGIEPRTPAPGMEPSTPMVQEPATPHTPGMVPQTPHAQEEDTAELGYGVLIDVEVLVTSESNFAGVVTDAAYDGSYVVVRMLTGDSEGKSLRVGGMEITPVQPRPEVGEQQELVKVLDGPMAGKVGRLQNVIHKDDDTLEGVIKFNSGETSTLNMSLVAKCHEASQH